MMALLWKEERTNALGNLAVQEVSRASRGCQWSHLPKALLHTQRASAWSYRMVGNRLALLARTVLRAVGDARLEGLNMSQDLAAPVRSVRMDF
jgi:hypothetical protein